MESLNPILENRNKTQDHIQKGFVQSATIDDVSAGNPALHRQFVANNIAKSCEDETNKTKVDYTKKLAALRERRDPEGIEKTDEVVKALGDCETIVEFAKAAATGEYEIYTEKNIRDFQTELRKSWDSNEITREAFTTEIRNVNQLSTVIIKGLDDTPHKIWFKKKSADQLEKGGKGEGSRGGKVIGHTKSGEPIYAHKLPANYKAENGPDTVQKYLESKGHTVRLGVGANTKETVYSNKDGKEHVTTVEYGTKHIHLKSTDSAIKESDTKSELAKLHEQDEEKFFAEVSKHYTPKDDGESESTMLENLAKHPKAKEIIENLKKQK